MWSGKEEKNRKQHYLHVTNKGFISIYGVLLLMMFLCFIMLITQRVLTFQSVSSLMEEYDIYAIRKGYHLYQETYQTSEEEMDQNKEEHIQISLFRNVNYKFICEEEKITVYYELQNGMSVLEIYFDKEDGSILSIAYL